jgi:hypothetical protein
VNLRVRPAFQQDKVSAVPVDDAEERHFTEVGSL